MHVERGVVELGVAKLSVGLLDGGECKDLNDFFEVLINSCLGFISLLAVVFNYFGLFKTCFGSMSYLLSILG